MFSRRRREPEPKPDTRRLRVVSEVVEVPEEAARAVLNSENPYVRLEQSVRMSQPVDRPGAWHYTFHVKVKWEEVGDDR